MTIYAIAPLFRMGNAAADRQVPITSSCAQ